MQDENITRGFPAQPVGTRQRLYELAAAWIQWARMAAFKAFSVSSAEVAEYAILEALVDANDDPLEQERIVYNVAVRVRLKGYVKPSPTLPTDPLERKRFVDAVCNQLAQRELWGSVMF